MYYTAGGRHIFLLGAGKSTEQLESNQNHNGIIIHAVNINIATTIIIINIMITIIHDDYCT